MASNDIAPVIDRIAALVAQVPNIGLVWPHDIWHRTDIAERVVSDINATPTIRAWYVTGPTMQSAQAVQRVGGEIERTWTYQVHGLTGLDETGAALRTLISLGLAVTDRLDNDRTLANTAHRTMPCTWDEDPGLRLFPGEFAACYLTVTKRVITLTTPT
jgi:hypothetical protein